MGVADTFGVLAGLPVEQRLPYVEAALKRKPRRAALNDNEIPTLVALGRQRAQAESVDGKTVNFGRGSEAVVPLEDPAKPARAGG